MKLILAVLVLVMIAGTQAWFFRYPGLKLAAERGPGDNWAAEVISDAKEGVQGSSGRGYEDSAADQEANRFGKNGGDLNKYGPKGLP